MQQPDEPPAAAATAAAATSPAAAASATAHEIGYHAFLSSQLPQLRRRLLAWYDEHRRLLPWRGDPPAAVAASTDAAAAASASASASSNDAFGAREKKARASAQQRKHNEENGVARFLLKPTTAGDAAASSSSSSVAAEAGVAAAAAPSAPAPAAADSVAAPPAPRTGVSAYGVWVSEIMLQQTRVETVIDYYTRWMARFPTVESLAAASPDEVQRLWAGLGYYRRARFLQQGARDVVEKHSGALPNSVDGLLSISGIGPYTAGAIGSIAFGLQAPLVDGNVVRVMSRLRAMEVDPKARTTEAPMWALARAALDPSRPGDWNQALMELGATVCTPLSPACGRCPVNDLCYAAREVRQRRRPCELTTEERQDPAPAPAAALPGSGPASSAAAMSSTVAPVVIDIEELCEQPASAAAPVAHSAAKPKGKSSRGKGATAPPDPFARPHDACSLCAPRGAPPDAVTAYPTKASKKAPLEQHVHVCALNRPGTADAAATGRADEPLYLIFRRPDAGLLAGQWELPSAIVPADASPADRCAAIEQLLSAQLSLSGALVSAALRHAPNALGDLVHVFSHRKHLMRVTAATLDASAAGLSPADAAALQAAFCDRTVPEAAAEPNASSSGGTKKRVAASKAKNSAKRSKRAAAADSDDEGEKEAADSDEAEAEEGDPASPRSYRWVSLSLLRQDHKMAGAGSELGLTSGVRKVVQLIGQGTGAPSSAVAAVAAAGASAGAKRKPRSSKAAGADVSDPVVAPKKRAKKAAAQVQPDQPASDATSTAPSPGPSACAVEVIELDSDGDECMTSTSTTAPTLTVAANNLEVHTPPTAPLRGARALRQSTKKTPAKPQASLHKFFAAAAAAPPRPPQPPCSDA